MRRESTISIILLLLVVITINLPARAQSFNVIHNFAGSDGSGPLAGLVMGANETLYGSAASGGLYGDGVVFKTTIDGELTVLHSFGHGNDGSTPESSLVIGTGGYLYGTTFTGGSDDAGTVFKISSKGVETILYNFAGGTDGANPIAGLTIDKSGNLYGTTSAGGTFNAGTVFEISPAGKHTILYNFGKATHDGSDPVAGVTFDGKGNLYGTTSAGGTYGYGIVFELTPSSPTWTETILHTFALGSDGGTPYAGIIFDRAGNLYGAATQGGTGWGGGGTIFELTPSVKGWNFRILYGLAGWGVSGTFANLFLDAPSGLIYATTHCDGNDNAGTVYQLTRSSAGWAYTQLYMLTGGTDGMYSYSSPVMDSSGHLYGTTYLGGANGMGVVFQVKP